MSKRYALIDTQWEHIKDLLPAQTGQPGTTAKDNRLFVDAVLYRYRAGIAWRDLPVRFGDFRVVHTRHSRWSHSGLWQRVFEVLAQDADNEYAMIDATIVRAHQHSAGAKGGSRPAGPGTQPRRSEHQNPCHGGCAGQPDWLSSHARAGP